MKKKLKFLFLFTISLWTCISCESRLINTFNLIGEIDSTPPKLEYIESNTPYSVEIVFDEILNDKSTVELIFNNEQVSNYSVRKNVITYYLKDPLTPGVKNTIEIKVEDLNGNSTLVNSFVYTKNNEMANVLISEVSTKGTSKKCDKVELVVTKSGSLAGIVIADGFNDNYSDRCILPDVYAYEGEFIVISFQNVETDCYISENKAGLSSNNGCVLVLNSPSYNSEVMDCLIYSNQKSENSEGFANENTLKTAKKLANLGMWENTYPLSNAAVDSSFETSTRTINRRFKDNLYFIDTNTNEDFYITVTGGDSFGKMNNEEEYNT